MDCTRLVNRLPFSSSCPPSWWYQLTRKQKRYFWYLTGGVVAVILLLSIILASSTHHGGLRDSAAADSFLSKYTTCKWDQWRLPNHIKPTAYDLSLVVDLQEPYTVAGQVQIHLNVSQETPCVVLHASGMTIGGASRVGLNRPGVQCKAPSCMP